MSTTEPSRIRLNGHPPIAATEGGGGCLAFLGVPFFAVGLLAIWASLFTNKLGRSGSDDPPVWLLTVFGAVFACAGLSVIWAGLAAMARGRAARKRKDEHPLEPWHWDYPWDSRRAQYGSFGEALQAFWAFLFLEAFLTPFHWWGFLSDERPLPVKVIVIIFDLVALAILWGAFHLLFQHLKYGASRFHFSRFPFRPGQAVDGGLEVSRKVAAAAALSLTLRYIEDVMESTGTGKKRKTERVLYRLHEVRQEVSPTRFDAGSDLDIPISMRLPSGDFSNRLLDTPRRYWELEVKAETPGIDYSARFLLPVY